MTIRRWPRTGLGSRFTRIRGGGHLVMFFVWALSWPTPLRLRTSWCKGARVCGAQERTAFPRRKIPAAHLRTRPSVGDLSWSCGFQPLFQFKKSHEVFHAYGAELALRTNPATLEVPTIMIGNTTIRGE